LNVANEHLVSIILSDSEVNALIPIVDKVEPSANDVVKRIIYQANNSPIFCSSYNKPIRHLNPTAAICQPFPASCHTCPMALFEE